MRKIALSIILLLGVAPRQYAASTKEPVVTYTRLYVPVLDVYIWSSDRVSAVGQLKLDPASYLSGKVGGDLIMAFEKGYRIKISEGKLYHNDSVIELSRSDKNIYISPTGWELGVFIMEHE